MSANEKPKADRASSWSDKLMAPGDGLRRWWDRLSRVQKWGFGVIGFGLLALLPLYPPPFLNTPNISFGGTMAQFAMVAIIAIGLNVVVGQTGLLDLGYVGFYAVGAYTVALLTSPNSPWNKVGAGGWFSEDWAWLACVPLAMAITALTGLILGSPTLRLRGDYLAIVTLGFGEIIRLLADNLADVTNGPRGLNEVAYPRVGETERLPEGVFSSGNSMGDANYGTWWFWLGIVMIVDHPAVRRQPGAQPSRTGLGGHPRGRGRRRNDGRQHVQVQAVGLRDRRGHRRVVRSALRRPGAVRRAADVQHHQLDAVSLRCGARRAGQQTRRGRSARSSSSTCRTACWGWRSSGSTSATSSTCSSGWHSWR